MSTIDLGPNILKTLSPDEIYMEQTPAFLQLSLIIRHMLITLSKLIIICLRLFNDLLFRKMKYQSFQKKKGELCPDIHKL